MGSEVSHGQCDREVGLRLWNWVWGNISTRISVSSLSDVLACMARSYCSQPVAPYPLWLSNDHFKGAKYQISSISDIYSMIHQSSNTTVMRQPPCNLMVLVEHYMKNCVKGPTIEKITNYTPRDYEAIMTESLLMFSKILACLEMQTHLFKEGQTPSTLVYSFQWS